MDLTFEQWALLLGAAPTGFVIWWWGYFRGKQAAWQEANRMLAEIKTIREVLNG